MFNPMTRLEASVGNVIVRWVDGKFYGPPSLVNEIRHHANCGTEVTMFRVAAAADDTTDVGALAAMWAAAPGRVEIRSASETLLEMFEQSTCQPGEHVDA